MFGKIGLVLLILAGIAILLGGISCSMGGYTSAGVGAILLLCALPLGIVGLILYLIGKRNQ